MIPKCVVSRTLTGSDWHNSHVVSGDVRAEIQRLKAGPGEELALFAGAATASSFIRLGLVDELRLLVNPLLQGGGTRLFDGTDEPRQLDLTSTRTFAGGAVVLTYALR